MHTPQRTMELSTSLGEPMQASANMERTVCGSSLLRTSRTNWAQPCIPGDHTTLVSLTICCSSLLQTARIKRVQPNSRGGHATSVCLMCVAAACCIPLTTNRAQPCIPWRPYYLRVPDYMWQQLAAASKRFN